MRKIFTLCVSLLIGICAFAQKASTDGTKSNGFQVKNLTGIVVKASEGTGKMAKPFNDEKVFGENKANCQKIASSQLIFGPYQTNEVATSDEGLGLLSFPGTLKIAAGLPVKDFMAFDGGKVVKMRVGLANAAAITRIFIAEVTNEGNIVDVFSQDVNGKSAGWNEFDIKTPYTLSMSNCQELFVGFDYTQTSSQTSNGSYPISVVSTGSTIYNTYVYGNLGNGKNWYDVGLGSMGNLSVQCFVESDNFPEKDIAVLSLGTDANYYKSETELTYNISLQNVGYGNISKCSFDVEIDDAVVTTLESNDAIASLEVKNITGTISVPSSLSFGEHKLGLRLKSVDGETPAGNVNNDYASSTFNVYSQSVPRQKNLIEQFTSQYCTYCPRGVTLFSDLIEMRKDIAWVSVHGNMSSGKDIFYIAANDTIMAYEDVSGFPSASYNRSFVPDLADNSGEIAYGLGYDMSYRVQIVKLLNTIIDQTASSPSFVTLNIEQTYDPETRDLNITVNGDGVENASQILNNNGITVMLTENNLIARQLNEGTWNQKFEHHYVLRSVLGKCTGNSINWQGDNFTANFKYTIPADYVKDNMYVVAFVAPMINLNNVNTMNMAINNCEMVAVKDASTTAIQNISLDSEELDRYTLDGIKLTVPQKGLNIIRMADGSVRKVMVK